MLYKAPSPVDQFSFKHSIFIAGGITGCNDWQTEVCNLIDTQTYDVYNPRRDGDLAKVGEDATKQIVWEYQALKACTTVVFWFPSTSICPITLFEFGVMIERASRGEVAIIVGRDNAYPRAFDIDTQIRVVVENEPAIDIVQANDFEELTSIVDSLFGRF